MNEENDWHRYVKGDAVEGPVVCVSREEVLQALDERKSGKASGPSEVSLELIAASGGVGIQVSMSKSPRWIWNASSNDIMNCSCYRAAKLLEHGMKMVERVLEKRPHGIVSVDEM